MDKVERIAEDVNDLKIAQARTTQDVEHLSEDIRQHIEKDDKRHEGQQTFLVKLSENVNLMTQNVNVVSDNINQFIPECRTKFTKLEKESTSLSATQKVQNWLLKSVVGVVIVAALGSFTTSVITCNMSNAQEVLRAVQDKPDYHRAKISPVPQKRQTMNGREATRNKFD